MTAAEDAPLAPRVYDCMVFLQAAVRDTGPSFACLDLAIHGSVSLFVSEETIAEVINVLSRPKIRRKFTALSDDNVSRFLVRVATGATVVENVPHVVTLDRDPKDEKYLNLSVAVAAEYLVTRDRDLLDLGELKTVAGRGRRAISMTTQIVDPAEFLRAIRSR